MLLALQSGIAFLYCSVVKLSRINETNVFTRTFTPREERFFSPLAVRSLCTDAVVLVNRMSRVDGPVFQAAACRVSCWSVQDGRTTLEKPHFVFQNLISLEVTDRYTEFGQIDRYYREREKERYEGLGREKELY